MTRTDTERTDTGAFAGKASVELEVGRDAQTQQLQEQEGKPETKDNEGANDDDATPPTPGTVEPPEREREPRDPAKPSTPATTRPSRPGEDDDAA